MKNIMNFDTFRKRFENIESEDIINPIEPLGKGETENDIIIIDPKDLDRNELLYVWTMYPKYDKDGYKYEFYQDHSFKYLLISPLDKADPKQLINSVDWNNVKNVIDICNNEIENYEIWKNEKED